MKSIKIEITTGLFMVLGLICMGYLAIQMGDVNLFGKKTY